MRTVRRIVNLILVAVETLADVFRSQFQSVLDRLDAAARERAEQRRLLLAIKSQLEDDGDAGTGEFMAQLSQIATQLEALGKKET